MPRWRRRRGRCSSAMALPVAGDVLAVAEDFDLGQGQRLLARAARCGRSGPHVPLLAAGAGQRLRQAVQQAARPSDRGWPGGPGRGSSGMALTRSLKRRHRLRTPDPRPCPRCRRRRSGRRSRAGASPASSASVAIFSSSRASLGQLVAGRPVRSRTRSKTTLSSVSPLLSRPGCGWRRGAPAARSSFELGQVGERLAADFVADALAEEQLEVDASVRFIFRSSSVLTLLRKKRAPAALVNAIGLPSAIAFFQYGSRAFIVSPRTKSR